MGQICLSLTLLTAAGLFTSSARRAAGVAPGFRLANSIVIELDPSLAGYNETRGRETYRALLARLKALPGVESASLGATVPFGMTSIGRSIRRPGTDPKDKRNLVECRSNIVDENYFQTMGIALLRGRSFLPAEGGGRTAVVLDRLGGRPLSPGGGGPGENTLPHPGGGEERGRGH